MDDQELDDLETGNTSKSLMEAVGFTKEDLEANRSGILTERQAERWNENKMKPETKKAYEGTKVYGAVLAVFGVLVGIGLVYMVISSLAAAGGSMAQFGVPIAVAVVLIFAGWIVYGANRAQRMSQELRAGTYRVQRHTGKVRYESSSSQYGSTTSQLYIRHILVHTNPEAYDFLEKGRKYHLYGVMLAPTVLMLLSAEPVEPFEA